MSIEPDKKEIEIPPDVKFVTADRGGLEYEAIYKGRHGYGNTKQEAYKDLVDNGHIYQR